MLTNNDIKGVVKVITYSENRGFLLKETTKKLTVKKEDYTILLEP